MIQISYGFLVKCMNKLNGASDLASFFYTQGVFV